MALVKKNFLKVKCGKLEHFGCGLYHLIASQGLIYLSTNACTLGLWFYNQSTANDGVLFGEGFVG